jgi:hypothetical protein
LLIVCFFALLVFFLQRIKKNPLNNIWTGRETEYEIYRKKHLAGQMELQYFRNKVICCYYYKLLCFFQQFDQLKNFKRRVLLEKADIIVDMIDSPRFDIINEFKAYLFIVNGYL